MNAASLRRLAALEAAARDLKREDDAAAVRAELDAFLARLSKLRDATPEPAVPPSEEEQRASLAELRAELERAYEATQRAQT